jgi:hypothetical protein
VRPAEPKSEPISRAPTMPDPHVAMAADDAM